MTDEEWHEAKAHLQMALLEISQRQAEITIDEMTINTARTSRSSYSFTPEEQAKRDALEASKAPLSNQEIALNDEGVRLSNLHAATSSLQGDIKQIQADLQSRKKELDDAQETLEKIAKNSSYVDAVLTFLAKIT